MGVSYTNAAPGVGVNRAIEIEVIDCDAGARCDFGPRDWYHFCDRSFGRTRDRCQIVPPDLSQVEDGVEVTCQKAITGDPDACFHLKRMIKRDPESGKAKRTAEFSSGVD